MSDLKASSNPLPRLKEFIEGQFRGIHGWCDPFVFQPVEAICKVQQARGLNLPVAEIGVHHGKFFIALMKTAKLPRTLNYAIDVFDNQEFNLDRSGRGDLDIFQENVLKCGERLGDIEIVKADSTTLSSDFCSDVKGKTGGFSFFSVDGSHRPEHTIHDLRIAMELCHESGVIFVDDYYNPSWPRVHEGICKLFFNEFPIFVPLLYVANKLFLCHIGFHEFYVRKVAEYMKEIYPGTHLKTVDRFGYRGLTLTPKPSS